ncbi:peptidylprolyl isomerase [Brevundimonas sp.]|uniref:peptidylprolyl isomerase n=1 Tax=Brevundimonas sp. TaxID=1871086 RepID=UPI001DAEF2F9|nr:peptidylprolyl isomerase [Brevundimonas sp.]MBA4001033.1 peptidylprolyl isomerase [Brevundimonas sp.]
MKFPTSLLAAVVLTAAVSPSVAQEAEVWRDVAPENLWVIDTSKGRVLVELAPDVAPQAVERIQTLTRQGFYQNHAFHRVIRNFMAQSGDPTGTGAGGSELPDVPGEFTFRRSRRPAFIETPTGREERAVFGLYGAMPVRTQPDAQMFVTADNRVDAMGFFCPGVAGMARSASPDSANSQFFLMTAYRANLNGDYTPFGRVLEGLDVVESLKAGSDAEDGVVTNPDRMLNARLAADMPENERPRAQVLDARSPRMAEIVQAAVTERGARLSVCDVVPPVRIEG